MKTGLVRRPMKPYGLLAALSVALSADLGTTMRMLSRSWDINGRERFNFDQRKARRQTLKNRRRGGGG